MHVFVRRANIDNTLGKLRRVVAKQASERLNPSRESRENLFLHKTNPLCELYKAAFQGSRYSPPDIVRDGRMTEGAGQGEESGTKFDGTSRSRRSLEERAGELESVVAAARDGAAEPTRRKRFRRRGTAFFRCLAGIRWRSFPLTKFPLSTAVPSRESNFPARECPTLGILGPLNANISTRGTKCVDEERKNVGGGGERRLPRRASRLRRDSESINPRNYFRGGSPRVIDAYSYELA